MHGTSTTHDSVCERKLRFVHLRHRTACMPPVVRAAFSETSIQQGQGACMHV